MAARILEQKAPSLRTLKFYDPAVFDLTIFIRFHEDYGWCVGRKPWRGCREDDVSCGE
jgi:hypothetical protein